MSFLQAIQVTAHRGDTSGCFELEAPVSGRVASLASVPDDVFSSGALGDGCVIWPFDEMLRAPVEGSVSVLMSHAVGLRTKQDVEVLLHIGIDTVEQRGKGFAPLVELGERVQAGTPLIRFDRNEIKACGHADCVLIIVVDPRNWRVRRCSCPFGENISAGECLLELEIPNP